MSYNLTPITAKIKKTTKGGITQPLLNVGAPVKMKNQMSSPAKSLGGVFGDVSYSKEQWAESESRKNLKNAVKGKRGLFGNVLNAFSPSLGAVYQGSKIAKASKKYKKAAKDLDDWKVKIGFTPPASDTVPATKSKAKKTKSHTSAEDTFGIGNKKAGNKKAKTGFAGDTPYSVQGGKGTIHGPKSSYDAAYKKRDRKVYGEMSKAEYIKEAKRQTKSFESTGKFDAPKAKKATSVSVIKPKVTIESKKPTADVNITVRPKAKAIVAPKTKTEVRKTAKINKKLSQAAEARAGGNEKKALRKEKAGMRKAARLAKKNK